MIDHRFLVKKKKYMKDGLKLGDFCIGGVQGM